MIVCYIGLDLYLDLGLCFAYYVDPPVVNFGCLLSPNHIVGFNLAYFKEYM